MPWGISHKYKFIFIHIPSTAGTSVCSIWEGSLLKEICKETGVLGGGHKTAMQLKEMFPDCFNKYFKFCIIRNPFERFVSKFYFRRYIPIEGPVFEWNDRDAQALLPQLYWVTDRNIIPKHEKSSDQFYRGDSHFGNIIIDEMIRMDNLNSGLKNATKR